MEYKKYDMGNYNLYLIKTTEFKTITISVNLRRKKDREDEVYCGLIKKIIGAATSKYHNLKELNKAFYEIYNPTLSVSVFSFGLDRNLCFESVFINEKYTKKGMNQKSIELVLNVLLNPYIENGAFNEELFGVCKHDYIQTLKALKDNPTDYANNRVWEEMDVYPYDECKLEDCIELGTKITAKDLADYYYSVFEKDSLDIFIAGDFDETEIKDVIKKNIKGNFQKSEQNLWIDYKSKGNEAREVIETSEHGQSNLAMGFHYDGLTEFERKYVSTLYNTILGVGWSSKLMQVVREKHSLCYTVYSHRDVSCGIFFIFAGIDAKNYEKAVELIKEQLQAMLNGDFDEESIVGAKQLYHNALTDIEDHQKAVLNTVASEILSGNDSVEVRKETMNKVTKEDIISLAKKIHLDVMYLLKGVKSDGKENL